MRKVFATLRALVEVLEVLSRDADPDGVGRSIRDEVLFSYLLLIVIQKNFNLLLLPVLLMPSV